MLQQENEVLAEKRSEAAQASASSGSSGSYSGGGYSSGGESGAASGGRAGSASGEREGGFLSGGDPGEPEAGDPSGGGSAGSTAPVEGEGGMDPEAAKRVPDDVGDGSDDDIVARQLREAAMAEEDPELREKLWDEYRQYKRSSGSGD